MECLLIVQNITESRLSYSQNSGPIYDHIGGSVLTISVAQLLPDYSLCVNPAFQHQGIARRTIEHAEKQTMDNGFQSVRLDAFSENPWALKLYYGLGYKKVGHADWRKGRFYLMEKHLVRGPYQLPNRKMKRVKRET